MGTRAVLDAMLPIVSELDPTEVKRRIVRTACTLVGARHGALGTIGPDGRVGDLVQNHRGAELARKVASMLGEDLYQLLGGEPVRGADLAAHMTSLGFPMSEQAGTTFLGVHIRSRRGFSGVIALTEKEDGEEFTLTDQELIVALASLAGAVVDNAQLSYEARQRELWVALQSEIATALLAGMEFDKVLDLVARGARELTDADISTVCLLDGSSSMTVMAADGLRGELLLGVAVPMEGTVSGGVVRTGEPAVPADHATEDQGAEPILQIRGIGHSMFVPLVSEGRRNGTLAVARLASKRPLDQTDFWLLSSFASQVSVALDYGRARAELERLALLDDQERIARDLHDTVIQQLFATGMSLQVTAKRMSDPVLAERVQQAVSTLDTTIRDLRATVFALSSPADGRAGLRAWVQVEAAKLSEPHNFSVQVDFSGPVDTAIGPDIQPQVMATLREALSNVARHAQATHVDIQLDVGSDIVLCVSDDGAGIAPEKTRRSGLRNLQERALSLGGRMDISSPPAGGTVLVWRVPLSGRPAAR